MLLETNSKEDRQNGKHKERRSKWNPQMKWKMWAWEFVERQGPDLKTEERAFRLTDSSGNAFSFNWHWKRGKKVSKGRVNIKQKDIFSAVNAAKTYC